MHYVLPIHINDRRLYSCPLFEGETVDVQAPYIIPCASQAQSELFRIEAPRGAKIMACSDGYQWDDRIDRPRQTAMHWEEASSTLIISFNAPKEILEKADLSQATARGLHLSADAQAGHFSICCYWQGPQAVYQEIKVIFRYYQGAEASCYSGGFSCHLTQARFHAYEMALDFGSEASQVAFRKYGEHQPIKLDLISELKGQSFYQFPDSEAKDFLQYDEDGDRPLLRSRFFIRKNWENLDPLAAPGRDHPLQILTHRKRPDSLLLDPDIQDDFVALPNLKLCELVNDEYLHIQVGNFHLSDPDFRNLLRRCIINQMMHACFAHLAYRHTLALPEGERAPMAIQLHLLVPNVYHQQQVMDLLADCQEDLQKIGQQYGIAAVEVLMVSESDAAFSGVYAKALSQLDYSYTVSTPGQSQNFLVLDAGKGSLDFSILSADPDHESAFFSRYKAGIPGSGQFLSFAIMEILADHMGWSVKEWVHYYEEETDLARKEHFLDLIEQFKIKTRIADNSDQKIHIPLPSEMNLAGLSLSLENALQRTHQLPDPKGFMSQAIHHLCQELGKCLASSGLEKMQFQQVILTGRAFHYRALRKGIEQALVDWGFIEHPEEQIRFQETQAKAICLNGPLSQACHINSRTDLVGALVLWRRLEGVPKNGWLRVKKAQKVPGNGIQAMPQVLPLNVAFVQGHSPDNVYVPHPQDSFMIGRYRYGFGHASGQLPAQLLRTAVQMKLAVDHQGYMIRYPSGKPAIRLTADLPFEALHSLVVKSIFPHGSMGTLRNFLLQDQMKEVKKDKKSWFDAPWPGFEETEDKTFVDLFEPGKMPVGPPPFTDLLQDDPNQNSA
ncbi:MAG: hypothetical protein AAFR61_27905 [Bacteroidota bacterium]